MAAPVLAATAVTATIAGVAMAGNLSSFGLGSPKTVPDASRTHRVVDPSEFADRQQPVSRSASRVTLTPKPVTVTGHKFLTDALNVRTGPGSSYRSVTVLAAGTRLGVTGLVQNGWAQVVRDGQGRWVSAAYLADTKPAPPTPAPTPTQTPTPAATPSPTVQSVLSSAPCATGSDVESGIVANAVTLHRSVCANFPQVKDYGGYRPDGEHADGHALDIMVYSDSGLGQQIADWVRANHVALHVDEVIWSQHIWTTQRSSEGWRLMPDRGSVTANHYDHVHVHVT